MFVEDGEGSGRKVGVTNDHLLKCATLNFEYGHYANHAYKTAYSVVFNATPTTDNSIVFYLKNQDDIDISITDIEFFSDSTQAIQMCLNCQGTPVSGTSITPANKSAGSADTASVVCQYGNHITGLSGSTMIDRVFTTGLNGGIERRWRTGIILPKNTTFSMSALYGDADIWATLNFYFHSLI